MSLFWIIIAFIGFYYIFFRKNKKNISPEESLRLAQEKEMHNKELEIERVKRLEEENKQKEQQERALELQRKKQLEEENEKISNLLNSNIRVYFSYSFVNENSELFLIDPENNSVIQSSVTTPHKLYHEGYRLKDVDKTGQSAQLDSFNFNLRFQK